MIIVYKTIGIKALVVVHVKVGGHQVRAFEMIKLILDSPDLAIKYNLGHD